MWMIGWQILSVPVIKFHGIGREACYLWQGTPPCIGRKANGTFMATPPTEMRARKPGLTPVVPVPIIPVFDERLYLFQETV